MTAVGLCAAGLKPNLNRVRFGYTACRVCESYILSRAECQDPCEPRQGEELENPARRFVARRSFAF